MTLTKKEPTFNPPLSQKIKKAMEDYGVVALILIIIASYVNFVWQINKMVVERADKQAEANYKIGLIEGKIEKLIQNQNNPCSINPKN